MPLDHIAQAETLEEIANTATNLAGSKSLHHTLRLHEEMNLRNKLHEERKKQLLGQADWHRDQAAKQNQSEQEYNLSELHMAARSIITKAN